MERKSNVAFDIARSLCVLWIVGIWHLKDYIDIDGVSDDMMRIGSYFTMAVLGVFTFMSGFFLKKYKIRNFSDAGFFYKKRLLRFGIPYFLATASIYIASMVGGDPWFKSPLNFVLSLFGLSVFYPPLPPTFWYFVMLMLFYIITPLLLVPQRVSARIILYIAIEVLFVILWLCGVTEDQCLLYFPMYALGLLVRSEHLSVLKQKPVIISLILLTPVLLGLSLLCDDAYEQLLSFVWKLLVLPFMIVISNLLAMSKLMSAVGQKLSYASMNMYLFHRHFYLFAIVVLNIHSLSNIHDATFPLWFGLLIVLPVIIAFSYYFQKVYDKVATRWL